MDLERAEVSQPRDEKWDGASDHTPLMYKVKDVGIKWGKRRVAKTMLNNRRNKLEEKSTSYGRFQL